MAAKNGKKKESGEPVEGRKFSFEYVFPPEQRVQFSNHVTVQHANEGEFILSFFEIFSPVVHGDEEQVAAQLKKIGNTVPANCIARVTVSAARMPNLIGALISNYERYEQDTGRSVLSENHDQESQKHAS